ncbi:adenosylcobinamide-GDP ribazoletransferase [Oceaniglobus trochenteri]|uniref:adenosylcobinamide-GDP ribazoletransferase n=1 Tax=Oceaniglobus trochenteri TaxID=2763260 RepID=UPI001CFF7718|nr:adenosylcobinamide-GDP ribazoletransferase [Oceaniglobus trochenteri]
MTRTDKPHLRDLAAALGLLSRLPLRIDTAHATARGARAAWAWPVAGAVIGALAGLVGATALGLGLPVGVAAGLALALGPVVTGCMHEDGLADAADGLWGGWERERRLAIMKDSSIGTYGVVALVLSLGLRWSALTALFAAGHTVLVLVGVAALSRLPMVLIAAVLPNARAAGLSASVGRPGQATALFAILATLAIALPALGLAALPAFATVGATALAAGAIARAKIGGQTGDILGATQQLCEIAALATLAAVLTP